MAFLDVSFGRKTESNLTRGLDKKNMQKQAVFNSYVSIGVVGLMRLKSFDDLRLYRVERPSMINFQRLKLTVSKNM